MLPSPEEEAMLDGYQETMIRAELRGIKLWLRLVWWQLVMLTGVAVGLGLISH